MTWKRLTLRQHFAIFAVALVVRVMYWALLAPRLLGNQAYFNNDSRSYTGFIELWETGVYTFDPTHPDARFGRVPVYPFVWGAHWLLFGDGARYAVAVSQTLLDSATGLIIAALAMHATERRDAAVVAGLLYAFYPFAMLWITITGTETLTTFLGASILLLLFRFQRPRDLFVVGALIGLGTLTREYLVSLGVIASLYVSARSTTWRIALQRAALLGCGFVVIFAWWPLRNIMLQGEPVLLRPATSGYHRYSTEVIATRGWLLSWTHFPDPYLDWIAGKVRDVEFPPEAFTRPEEKAQLARLKTRALECSTGFHYYRTNRTRPWERNCNAEVADGFQQLMQAQLDRHPWRYVMMVPLRNLAKVFFKNELTEGSGVAIRFGLMCRTLLLLLGILGAFLLRRSAESATLHTTFTLHVLLTCVMLRFVEMRYLLWVDSLMLVPAAYVIVRFSERVRLWKSDPVSA